MADDEWLDDHIELFAISALDAAETIRAETELAALPAMRRRIYDARVIEIQSAMSEFASGYALPAPTELRQTVLDHVFTHPQAGAEPEPTEPEAGAETPHLASVPPESGEPDAQSTVVSLAAHRRRRVALAVASAAAVAAVALGAGVIVGRSTAPEPPQVSASNQQVAAVLDAPDATISVNSLPNNQGTMSVVASRSQNRAVAVLKDQHNRLPADRAFQLWLVGGENANPVSAGVVGSEQLTTPVLVDGIDTSTTLAVTIEPSGGSPQPTTSILTTVAL